MLSFGLFCGVYYLHVVVFNTVLDCCCCVCFVLSFVGFCICRVLIFDALCWLVAFAFGLCYVGCVRCVCDCINLFGLCLWLLLCVD